MNYGTKLQPHLTRLVVTWLELHCCSLAARSKGGSTLSQYTHMETKTNGVWNLLMPWNSDKSFLSALSCRQDHGVQSRLPYPTLRRRCYVSVIKSFIRQVQVMWTCWCGELEILLVFHFSSWDNSFLKQLYSGKKKNKISALFLKQV